MNMVVMEIVRSEQFEVAIVRGIVVGWRNCDVGLFVVGFGMKDD